MDAQTIRLWFYAGFAGFAFFVFAKAYFGLYPWHVAYWAVAGPHNQLTPLLVIGTLIGGAFFVASYGALVETAMLYKGKPSEFIYLGHRTVHDAAYLPADKLYSNVIIDSAKKIAANDINTNLNNLHKIQLSYPGYGKDGIGPKIHRVSIVRLSGLTCMALSTALILLVCFHGIAFLSFEFAFAEQAAEHPSLEASAKAILSKLGLNTATAFIFCISAFLIGVLLIFFAGKGEHYHESKKTWQSGQLLISTPVAIEPLSEKPENHAHVVTFKIQESGEPDVYISQKIDNTQHKSIQLWLEKKIKLKEFVELRVNDRKEVEMVYLSLMQQKHNQTSRLELAD